MVPWVCVDFDHTLVELDTPLPGAKEAMQSLKDKGYGIIIHSCNNKGWIEKVLRANDIPFDYIWDASVDKGKPVADAYIDDRAVGFAGDWKATVEEVVNIEKRRERIHDYERNQS
jgi:beta-phosphoglucomutase-like phosphatase (HAD superfamily)